MSERVIVGNEEPSIAAPLYHFSRGADGERAGVEYPLDSVGRTELAVKICRSGRLRDEQLLLFVGDVLHGEPHGRYRHVDDQVDLIDIVPAPRNAGADIRFELMISHNYANRFAEHLAP